MPLLRFRFAIGAFFGALLLDQRHFVASRCKDLRLALNSITDCFLAPVLFASLKLDFKFTARNDVAFVVDMLIVAIATTVAAGWRGVRRSA